MFSLLNYTGHETVPLSDNFLPSRKTSTLLQERFKIQARSSAGLDHSISAKTQLVGNLVIKVGQIYRFTRRGRILLFIQEIRQNDLMVPTGQKH